MPIYVESDDGPDGIGSAPPSQSEMEQIWQGFAKNDEWLRTPDGQKWEKARNIAIGLVSLSGR